MIIPVQTPIVDTHLHGPLAEVVFLLRAKEHEVDILELLLKQQSDENQKLREWNKKYHEMIYGKGT